MRILSKYLKLNNYYFITVICSISIVTTYIQQKYMIIPQLEDMPIVNELLRSEIMEHYQKMRWLFFLLTPVILFIRILLVAICFFIGSLLFENFGKMKFNKCFNIALKADIILLSSAIALSALLVVFDYESAINHFRCTSLLYFFDLTTIESWLVLPIGLFNVFEFIYWFFISALIATASMKSYKEALSFVVCTYGTGLIIFNLLMIFIALYISQ